MFERSVISVLFGSAGTRDGNGNGAPCVFPFIYQGVSYNQCITAAALGADAFCSVTNNYDNDGLYGYCTTGATPTTSLSPSGASSVTDTVTRDQSGIGCGDACRL